MCDFEAGRLIVTVPNNDVGKDTIEFLRKGGIPNCHLESRIDTRLEALEVSTWPLEQSRYLYCLVRVPEGDEYYMANLLMHVCNGRRNSPGVISFAQPDLLLSLMSTPQSDPKDFDVDTFANDDVKNMTNVRSAHGNGYLGDGITVCVFDSGMARSNPARSSDPNSKQSQYSVDLIANSKGLPDDNQGHGSAISWIIHDIAPKADIVMLRVANAQGRANEWDIVAAIYTAFAAGADIFNMSLQFGLGTTNCGTCGRASHSSKSLVFQTSLTATNISLPIIVAATGNDADKQKSPRPSYPARFREVIAIGSINSSNDRSSFSNYNVPHKNFFVMPGGDLIKSGGFKDEYFGKSYDGTRKFAGTSIACAYASGLFSLYKSMNPTFNNDQVLALAHSNAKRAPHWTTGEYGAGMIRL